MGLKDQRIGVAVRLFNQESVDIIFLVHSVEVDVTRCLHGLYKVCLPGFMIYPDKLDVNGCLATQDVVHASDFITNNYEVYITCLFGNQVAAIELMLKFLLVQGT